MTWVPGATGSGFDVDHLPYGVFGTPDGSRRIGVAVGPFVLDLSAALDGSGYGELFAGGTLNPFLGAGPAVWSEVRRLLQSWLTDPAEADRLRPLLFQRSDVSLQLPFEVADYVDFYASEHHASTVGRIFRPDREPLPANWKHLPIGYHGRAGTVVVSGTDIVRPSGQTGPGAVGPSQRLDLEVELGFVVGVGSSLGDRVALQDFREHIFGVTLLNDWSARDLQAWEYVPLGPFLGKSFATSVSAWVTPLAALAGAWTAPPVRTVPPVGYLDDAGRVDGLDIQMELSINGGPVSGPVMSAMYWTAAQMLAHLTVNGARLRTGDLFASGTVSGPGATERGSLIELTSNGADPITLADGSPRGYLQDGDEVLITATAPSTGGSTLTLGEVRGRVLPARPMPG